MAEYQQTQAIDAPPGDVFAWLSDVNNLPKYLPPVTDAQRPSEGRIRTTLEYPGGEGSFDAEGYFRVDEGERRMEWGAEVQRDYSGWLTVTGGADGGSEVTVHLNFGPRTVEPEIQEQSPEGEDPLARGVSETLEYIRRQMEEGAGKVQPTPPPGADPDTENNPAVVRDDPPDS